MVRGLTTTTNTNNSTNRNSTNNSDNDDKWRRVVSSHNVCTILLAVSLDDGNEHDSLCATIVQWKNWLNSTTTNNSTSGTEQAIIPVVRLLLIWKPGEYYGQQKHTQNKKTQFQWMRLGAAMEVVCHECRIASWHVTTASSCSYDKQKQQVVTLPLPNGVESTDALFCSILQKNRQQQQQQQPSPIPVGTSSSPPQTPTAAVAEGNQPSCVDTEVSIGGAGLSLGGIDMTTMTMSTSIHY
jgi:hypothetical protein